MFLFDPGFASDFSRVEQEVERLMQRAEAQIIMSRKWDERKLAYEIKGRKRGCYVLTFFRASRQKVAGLERDVRLSESILRVLILKVDYMTEEDMAAAYGGRGEPAARGGPAAKPAAPAPAAPAAPAPAAPAPAAPAVPAPDAPVPAAPAAETVTAVEAKPDDQPETAPAESAGETATEPAADSPVEPGD
jgi:ribosomal protein S6